MAATATTSLVSLLVQALPRPVLGLLDAWSHRVARRRWRERQQKLARRHSPVVDAAIPYQLRPWRD